MSQHSVAETKDHLSSLIDRAMEGESVVITRHGAPVARLVGVEEAGHAFTHDDIVWLRRHRAPRRSAGVGAGQFVSEMRDEDDERLFRR